MRSNSEIMRPSDRPEAITRLMSCTTPSTSARARASVRARAGAGRTASPSAASPAVVTKRRVGSLVIGPLLCDRPAEPVIRIGIALACRAAQLEAAVLQVDRARQRVAVLAFIE